MAFRSVGTSNAIDIKKFPNEPHEGVYVGSRQIPTRLGPQTIYEFTKRGGEVFGIYGFTNLNRSMENIRKGSLVRVTYKGTKTVQTKYGLKPVHQALIEIDEDAPPEEALDEMP